MDWMKDPVLMEMRNRTTFAMLIAVLAFGVATISAFILAYSDDVHQHRALRRLAVLEARPSIQAQADRDWCEINRRLDALERRPRLGMTTVTTPGLVMLCTSSATPSFHTETARTALSVFCDDTRRPGEAR